MFGFLCWWLILWAEFYLIYVLAIIHSYSQSCRVGTRLSSPRTYLKSKLNRWESGRGSHFCTKSHRWKFRMLLRELDLRASPSTAPLGQLKSPSRLADLSQALQGIGDPVLEHGGPEWQPGSRPCEPPDVSTLNFPSSPFPPGSHLATTPAHRPYFKVLSSDLLFFTKRRIIEKAVKVNLFLIRTQSPKTSAKSLGMEGQTPYSKWCF